MTTFWTLDCKRVSEQCSKTVFRPQGTDNLLTPIRFDSPAPRSMAEIIDIFLSQYNSVKYNVYFQFFSTLLLHEVQLTGGSRA
jgi:hypothetical protein